MVNIKKKKKIIRIIIFFLFLILNLYLREINIYHINNKNIGEIICRKSGKKLLKIFLSSTEDFKRAFEQNRADSHGFSVNKRRG